MKKLFAALVLTATILHANAQEVRFKLSFAPKTTYTIARETKMNMNMTPPEALAAMSGGQKMDMVMSMNTTNTVITGTRGADNWMPAKMSIKTGDMKMTMNGQDLSGSMPTDLPDTKLYIKYKTDNTFHVDSVAGQKVTDSVMTLMNKLVDQLSNSIKFPDHPIKVGESFTQIMPLNIPLPGITDNNMNISMTYKLIGVSGNIASFEFTEKVDASVNPQMQGQQMKINMNGSGNGTMTYDIGKQFYTAMTNNMDLTMSLNMSGMDMNGKISSTSVDKVQMAAN